MPHIFTHCSVAFRVILGLLLLVGYSPAQAQTPTISSFSPTSGGANTLVTITGTNLTNIRSVVVRGIPCNITPISGTQVSFRVPAQASTGRLRLTTTGGTVLSGSAFTVTRASTSLTYALRTNTFNSIAVGGFSTPAFTDLDHDGLIDLLVGRETDGLVSHYEQSSANSTSFTLRATNLSGFSGHYNSLVSVTDIDGDGLLDIVVGTGAGNFKHYEQSTPNGTSFTLLANDFNNIFSTGGLTYQIPHFTDIDGDGLLDLLVGDEFLSRYEQTTANGGTFNQLNNQNFGPTADAQNGGAQICVVDLDGNDRLDLLVGGANGRIAHYQQNSANGTAFTNVTATFNGLNMAGYTAPAITDLDGDGLLDMLVGGSDGALRHFEQLPPAPTITSFTPTSGPAGTQVTITGTNLTGATAVTVNGTAATLGTNTATSLAFTVGAGSTTGAVSVVTAGGTATGGTFTVTAAPITITSLSPTRNQRNAAAGSNVAVTFSQTMSTGGGTLGAVKVFSHQRGGQMQNGARGTTTQSGSTLTFNPTNDFKPGETVSTTVTTAATSSGGAALARGQVHQFTAATGGTGRGNFLLGSDLAVSLNPTSVALGDVDGDGDLDLLTANANSSGTVSVRLNGGNASGSNTGVFSGGSNPSVGTTPRSVALGDVDGDGDLDLLTANYNTAGTVSVRLNGGNASGSNTGVFSGGSDLAVGPFPTSVALGDVDGDGDLDLVTANTNSSGTVSVRLNGGNASGSNTGIFSGGSDPSVLSAPASVALGDVDGDGDLDLVTAYNNLGNSATILLNGGNATGSNTGVFSAGSSVAVGAYSRSVALGDVDGDGDLDLLTANYNTAGTVSVRLNGGNATGSNTGVFSAGSDPVMGTRSTSVALGDIDSDGDLDFVTTSFDIDNVNVRLNNGTGSFTAPATNPAPAVGDQPTSVALGDVDGDGDLDFVATNSFSDNVSVRLNQAPAPTITSFTPPSGPVGTSVTITGTNLTGATAARVNGTAGTITANTATSLTFTVGAGSTTGAVSVVTPGGTATGSTFTVTAAPITITALSPTRNLRNAAATSSVAVTFSATMANTTATQRAVRVFSQQRGGRMFGSTRGVASVSGSTVTFNPTNDFRPGETVYTTVTTAATSSGGTTLVRAQVHQFTAATGGTGTGNFVAPATNPDPSVGDGPTSVAAGDVDGDGDLDFVTANQGSDNASVRLNDGTGNFTAPATNPNPAVGDDPQSVALGDVDGDGDLDLLVANQGSDHVSVRLNGGAGSFTAPGTNPNPTVGDGPTSVAVGDVDGDGDLDFVTANAGSDNVSVRLNDGTGNFTPPATNPNPAAGDGAYSVALGDVDGDGDLDLLTTNLNAATVSVRLNDGTGNFTAPATNPNPAVGSFPISLAVGDVDGDGDLDFVTANQGSDNVSVRLNDGTGNFTAPATNPNPAVGDGPSGVALGDVDGDGDLDLLTANYGFGTTTMSVRLNDGTGNFTAPATNPNPSVGDRAYSVVLGDVDGDGDLDLLAAKLTSDNVSVRLNQPAALAPTITSFTPTSGPVGTSVTITGTNLSGATAARVNGTAGTITANTATSLTFTVGAGSSTGTVSVTTPGGTATGSTFTVCTIAAIAQNVTLPLDASGNATVSAAAVNNGSTASCGFAGGGGLSVSPNTFTCANLGANTVTLTVTDANGTTATATATVTVQDTSAPSAPAPLPAAPALALTNVPEAAGYGVVYQLDMPASANFGGLAAVPYAVNNSATSLPANPARVAYFLELTNGSGTKWVWASMDNFAPNLAQLGVPHPTANPVAWHQSVTGLSVFSNNGGSLVTGSALGTGRVEMWPSNYNGSNPDGVAGASASAYDFGDGGFSSTSSGYASFQVHNLTAQQTVLAYNGWGSSSNDGVGIGNQPTGEPDWTFVNNTASYTVKRLYILVPNAGGSFVQPATLALAANGTGSVLVNQVYQGNATDNCSAVTPSVVPSAFTCANLGANTVTVTLTDATGNATSQTTTVTVTGPPAPTLTGLSPAAAPAGSTVTATGTNLNGATSLTVNGAPATISSLTATGFTFVVPAGATATGNVVLNAPCSQQASRAFTAAAPLLLTGLAPARNAPAAPVGSNVALTFNQALTNNAATRGAVKVFSSQQGGRLQNGTGGTATVSGNTVTFNPTTNFRPGETISTTVTTAATSTGGATLTAGQVHQFITAVGGTGRGNFVAPTTNANVSTGARPLDIAMGDVDGDGDLDMLTANSSASTVSLRLNTGSGVFGGSTEIAVAAPGRHLTLGDVDGDGDLDLVAACYGATFLPGNSTVSIRLNDGSGNFSAPALNAEVSTEPRPYVVKLGDIDGDGDLDLVVAMYNNSTQGVALVRFNDGSGGFTGTQRLTMTNDITTLEFSDVDGDGDLDLLMAQSAYFSGLADVGVFLNDGAGVFGTTASFTTAVGSIPSHIRVGDVDGDGDLDFVAASINSSVLNVRLNDGTGTFTTPPSGNYNVSDAVVGMEMKDIDADGDLDLVFNKVNSGKVSVLRNDGTGAFAVPPAPYQDISVDNNNFALALADIDGDGDLDMLSAGSTANRVNVRFNQPSAPTITALSALLGPEGTSITVTGTNLTGATAVAFNGTNAASFTGNSATQITATVPVGAASGTVSVVTPDGTATSAATFTVLPIFTGTFNTCLPTTSVTSTGSATWQYLRAANGDLVLAINDEGTALGTVSVDFYLNQGAVRVDGLGREYFDRNWKLNAQNAFTGQNVRVRFYARNPEYTAYAAANDGDANDASSLGQLKITQYSGANEDCQLGNNTWLTADVRLLTPASNEALPGANWFALETVVADHFSEFFLNGGNAPLPVELVAFEAKRAASKLVSLTWRTASEKNNRGYYIERSANGREFTAISGLIAGAGTTQTPQAYAYADQTAPASVLYYRLRQVDTDGTTAYSDIVAVQPAPFETRNQTLAVWPNPVLTGEQVHLNGAAAAAPVALYDVTGRAVASTTATADGTATLPTDHLPAGVYVLRTGKQAVRVVLK